MNDQEALRLFVEAGDESAFAWMTERHINLVFSCALRQVQGDRHLAEDVTQAVFIVLAKKARSLRSEVVLAAWLVKVTRYAALDAMKARRRREKHERKAAEQAGRAMTGRQLQELQVSELEWRSAKESLDEAITSLRESDRQAVLLRFYERKSFSQVGASLGIDEEAARKRVSRATQKLRAFLTSRGGVVSSISLTAILSAIFSAKFTQAAPAELATSVSANALKSGSIFPESFVHEIVRDVQTRYAVLRLRIALYFMIGLTAFCIACGMLIQHELTHTETLAPAVVLIDNAKR